MKFSKSVLSILVFSFGFCGAASAASQSLCFEVTTEIALTEEIAFSVRQDSELGAAFDPATATQVLLKRQGCETGLAGLATMDPTPDFPSEGDTRILVQKRDGATRTWTQVYTGGVWITLEYKSIKLPPNKPK